MLVSFCDYFILVIGGQGHVVPHFVEVATRRVTMYDWTFYIIVSTYLQ